jgi:hypothetical protein
MFHLYSIRRYKDFLLLRLSAELLVNTEPLGRKIFAYAFSFFLYMCYHGSCEFKILGLGGYRMKKRSIADLSCGIGYSTAVFF